MEENNIEKAVEIADKLVELQIETNRLIESDQEVIDGCKNLISKCDKILNSN